MRLFESIDSFPKVPGVTIAAMLVVLIGFLDYLSGYELSLSAFYVVPLFILAWKSGRFAALAGALAGALARTLADLITGRETASPVLLFWNSATRLFLFCVIALVAAELKRLLDHERLLAVTDHLTGAANHRAFHETLAREMDRSRRYRRPFTLAYFDLDNFKEVNDSFGHAEGDAVLRTIVAAVRENGRATDTIGRMGGDEFAILLLETDAGQARTAIAKLKEGIGGALRARGWSVTASFGVVTVTDGDTGVDPLLRRADALMYEAKMSGGNGVRFG